MLSFDLIVVDVVKLRQYCLSDSHPRGRHKARVFRSKLGLTDADSDSLRQILLHQARTRIADLQPNISGQFGERFTLDFPHSTSVGTATIRSAWIVLTHTRVLTFVTCYVLPEEP